MREKKSVEGGIAREAEHSGGSPEQRGLQVNVSFAVVALTLDMSHAMLIASAQSLGRYPSSMSLNIATKFTFKRPRTLSTMPLY